MASPGTLEPERGSRTVPHAPPELPGRSRHPDRPLGHHDDPLGHPVRHERPPARKPPREALEIRRLRGARRRRVGRHRGSTRDSASPSAGQAPFGPETCSRSSSFRSREGRRPGRSWGTSSGSGRYSGTTTRPVRRALGVDEGTCPGFQELEPVRAQPRRAWAASCAGEELFQ
jgi:hypothetical protein